ncbi:MAG: hypothetical protein M1835_004455 [Candelina submexicana]|nr:MAG: hypothetical protein M1835_004455 [Candelina submexicana]
MQNRIDRLEGLVLSLMTNGAQSAGPTAAAAALSTSDDTGSNEHPQLIDDESMIKEESDEEYSDTDQVAKSFGVMRVDNNKSYYVGDAHWAAILSDISEVKNYFAEHTKQFEDQILKIKASRKNDGLKGPALIFGGSASLSHSELLASLPSRTVTDKIVSRYFNTYDPSLHILHRPTFQKQYEQHWVSPANTKISWLGLLFAILSMGMLSYYRTGEEPVEYRGKTLDLAGDYRRLTAQCLMLSDFATHPVHNTIETLILYLHGEYTRSRDSDVGVWVMVGMIVRLAMRMGYHRDPKFYPNISPFQGEMRRRMWTLLWQSDILFSFQTGLPSMIRSGDCDSTLPRSLYDDELDENTQELPVSRPYTEPTPVSYMITKARLSISFGNILEKPQSLSSPYEDIMKLDNSLRENLASTPPHLRIRSMDESGTDPAHLIMQRINLDLLYNKGQCVLHRKFLGVARVNSRYAHSRRTCVDSSMEILRHQATLHYECQPNRRLRSVKWYISSLTTHDFLLAAMIVALDLYYGTEAERAGRNSGDLYTWGLDRRADMMEALEMSKSIWEESQDHSMEAYKASKSLIVMLDKLKRTSTGNAISRQAQTPFPPSGRAPLVFPQEDSKPEHSAAMTLGMLSNGGVAPSAATMYERGFPTTAGGETAMGDASAGMTSQYSNGEIDYSAMSMGGFSPFAPGMGTVDMPQTNLDWDAWDSYIQSNSIEPPAQIWPSGMEFPASPRQSNQGTNQYAHQSNVFGDGSGVFMGVNTPPQGPAS